MLEYFVVHYTEEWILPLGFYKTFFDWIEVLDGEFLILHFCMLWKNFREINDGFLNTIFSVISEPIFDQLFLFFRNFLLLFQLKWISVPAEYENYAITKERKDAFICKWNDKNSANFRIFRQIDGLLVYMQFDEFFHFSNNVLEK